MKNLSSLLLCACMLVTVAYGQGDVRTRGAGAAGAAPTQTSRKVTGRVLDASGQPLPGATVAVVNAAGTSIGGGYTDANGAFSLNVPEGTGYSLRVTYVGFGTYTTSVQAAGDQTVSVQMQEESTTTEEVVVVGYGTQVSRRVTGSIATVTGDQLANMPVTSFEQGLQGRAAGVVITNSSGKVGQGIIMRIRGATSVTAGNQPLFVVDDIILANPNTADLSAFGEPLNPLANIDFNDIESFTILKDAQATSIYGSRGSNGVVIIKTKRGRVGKATTTIDYSYTLNSPTNYRKFLNAAQYVELLNEAGFNAGFSDPIIAPNGTTAFINFEPGFDTDWQRRVLLENRPQQQLRIATQGGNDATQFGVSFGLNDQFGILAGNRYNRANGRISVDHKFSPKVKMGFNAYIARSITERQADDNAFSNLLQNVALSPVARATDPSTGGPAPTDFVSFYPNPELALSNSFSNTYSLQVLSTAYVEAELIKGLKWRGELATEILDQSEETWNGFQMVGFTGVPDGLATSNSERFGNYQARTSLGYSTVIAEDHAIDAQAVFEFQFNKREFAFVQGQGLPNDDLRYVENATRFTAGGSGFRESRFDSYILRLNYTWKDRLVVNTNARLDGSSRFGSDNRYGFFGGAGIAYLLSSEEFIKQFEFVSLVKPRVSYGRTGNAEIGNYTSRTTVGSTAYKDQAGVLISNLGDNTLTWETTDQWNAGIDLGFFNDRLTFQFDYYDKQTKGLLLFVQLPAQSGFTTALRNVGRMQNRGWEVTIGGKVLTGELKWDVQFNIASNRNTVLELSKQPDGTPIPVFVGGDVRNEAREGHAIGTFFGARFFGVDPANGNALYQLPNGTLTTSFTAANATRQDIGNPNPDFFGGVRNTLSWKNFDFDMFWQFSVGADVLNEAANFMQQTFTDERFLDNQLASEFGRWRQPGDLTNVPRAEFGARNGNRQSSKAIQDASYWRLKNITLGYTLPTEWVSKLSLTRVRVYVTAMNLITITQFQGWDPEVSTQYRAFNNQNSNLGIGRDFYTVPQAKSFQFGITVQF